MKKKLCTCSILLMLTIFIGATGYWGHASSSRSKENAYKDHLAKHICFVLTKSEYVHEAIINTETHPIQANIIVSNNEGLPPKVKEYIEKLILSAFPDAIMDFKELSQEEIPVSQSWEKPS